MIENIGIKIKQLRISKGFSQEEMCSDTLNRTILSHIENNKMLPSIIQLNYIADKLGADIRYFFTDNANYNYNNFEPISIFDELYNTKEYEKIINIYKKEKYDIDDDHITILYYVGISFFYLNIRNDSLKFLRRFIYRYTKLPCEKQQELSIKAIVCLNTLFKLMLRNNNYDKAIRYLQAAKKYIYEFNAVGTEESFIIHSNLAWALFLNMKYKEVIKLLEYFTRYNKRLIYSDIIPDIHLSLSFAYENTGEYSLALKHLKKSSFFYNYIGKTDMAILTNLNFINIYRYSNEFDKAFSLIEDCKLKSKSNSEIYVRFQMEEAVVNFNINNYKKTSEILNKILYKSLNILSKKEYTLMKAHVAYINKEYKTAVNLYRNCKNYFLLNNYNYDLSLIYSDLFHITSDVTYLKLLGKLKTASFRKNIVIEFCMP